MRRDRALLDDMIEAAASIGAIVAGTNYQELLPDEVRKAAILHHLAVIGEAAGRISSELRDKYPRIPWSQIMSQRNRVVHEYFGIDWALIWKTVSEDLPLLRERLTELQRIEFSEGMES
jgi:uncharacterized protein with HEPN domain